MAGNNDPSSGKVRNKYLNILIGFFYIIKHIPLGFSSFGFSSLQMAFSYQFPSMPWGLEALLEYFKQTYGNPTIYIVENGRISLSISLPLHLIFFYLSDYLLTWAGSFGRSSNIAKFIFGRYYEGRVFACIYWGCA